MDSLFRKSSQFMAIYNSDTTTFVEFNESMKKRIGSDCLRLQDDVRIVSSGCEEVFLTISGIPCRSRAVLALEPGLQIVELFPAHTKRWDQSSDLVHLSDLTSDGVWEWFPELDFEYMSVRFWDILGYDQNDKDENPGSWINYVHPEDQKLAMDTYKKHIETKGVHPYHQQVRYTHKLGQEVYVLCRGSVVDWLPDGRPWRLLGTHTDVTQMVKKDAVEAQSKFIARMSHEIRSPVCTILAECESLQDVDTKTITGTCQQLIRLTDNILCLEDSGMEDLILLEEDVELQPFFVQCNKRHKLQAKKKQIRLRLITGDLPDKVRMDVGKCNQVIDNLINNSVKYSEGGCITLDVAYDEDDYLCEVRVQDEGIGVPESMFFKIFEEFVQGDSTMQGAGIGLTLCKRYAAAMGGDVTIESSVVGSGTTFLFTFKFKTSETSETSETSREVRSDTLREVRIMIVDDINTNRNILAKRLEFVRSMGLEYVTVEAVDGEDAFNKFKESGGDFQLILMDCLMPVIDGFEATSMIHQQCEKFGIEPVPVVAVTASVCSDIHAKCRKHGMKYVVTKPYTKEELLLSIRACMPNL